MREENKNTSPKEKGLRPTAKAKSQKGHIMNARFFRFDFTSNTIVGSKTAIKKAGNPDSKEYKELMKLREIQPEFQVVEKEVKKSSGKQSYKGLNRDFVEAYISIQPNADTLNKQYKEAKEMGTFPLVRKWFLTTFKEFDMEEAKREIEEAKLLKIKKAA